MSELKAITVYDAYWKATSNGDNSIPVYLKLDVDTALIEKDAEIAQLQAMLEERNKQVGELTEKLEDAKATAYTESVDAGMRERRLNYKYWNDMADEAAKMKRLIEDGQIIYLDEYCNEKDWRIMHKVWKDRETECRAKAEEYR